MALLARATLAATATLLRPSPVRAQARDDGLCSCSPLAYTFRLDFDGTCAEGVEGVCFFTRGGDPTGELDELSPPGWRRSGGRALQGREEERRAAAKRAAANRLVRFARQTQRQGASEPGDDFDTTPAVVTSVTFIEFDRNVQEILRQNSTYFNTTLADGDELVFASASAALNPDLPLADQEDFVPGGAMLVLFGENTAGEVIQNTVAWSYDADECDAAATVDDVGANGWAEAASVTPARPAFCPGATSVAPTDGSAAPSVEVTERPTLLPSPAPSPVPSYGPTGDASKTSKSGKGSKDSKSYYTVKSKSKSKSKSAKAETSKSSKSKSKSKRGSKSAKYEYHYEYHEYQYEVSSKLEESESASSLTVVGTLESSKSEQSRSKSEKAKGSSKSKSKSAKAWLDPKAEKLVDPKAEKESSRSKGAKLHKGSKGSSDDEDAPSPAPSASAAPTRTPGPSAPDTRPQMTPFPTVEMAALPAEGRSGAGGARHSRTWDGTVAAPPPATAAASVANHACGWMLFALVMVFSESLYLVV